MKYRDIALNSEHDLEIIGCDFKLTDGSDIVSQKLKQKLKTIQGEWSFNEDLGIPYLTEILVKNPFIDRIKSIFIKAIQSVEEIVSITELDVFLNNNRTLTVKFKVLDNQGYVITDSVRL
jgi:hypothetical protein